ncbi:MAG TPA: prepilin-type N-terminal cleavage/methylation domain-containing protein, partial [bacterium]|nr:prepilin-type N-terminal cleavage/methylation domain-containing protein [bacterium]
MTNKIRRSQGHRGFTIVELLVAMAIAAIFFTSFFTVVATTLETLRTGDERTVAQQNARFALQTLVAELRTTAEIEPRPAREASDPGGLPGLPRTPDANNPMTGTADDGWPVLQRSTDDSTRGYIELDHRDANGGDEQYEEFRGDGRPFDVRPLSPNRLTVKLGNPQFYGNTEYQFLNPTTAGGGAGSWDLDDSTAAVGGTTDNPTTANTIVTYEHQVAPPRVPVYDTLPGTPTVYDYLLDGLVKRLYVMNNSNPLILDTDAVNLANGGQAERTSLTNDLVPEFYLLRSFSTENPTNVFAATTTPTSLYEAPSGLGNGSRRGVGVFVPQVHLRQPVADHVIDTRFRYWTHAGGTWFEIRYDPNVERAGQGSGGP